MIVYVLGVPGQLFTVGVTVIVALIDEDIVLVALKPVISPVPEAAKPIAVLLFVQAKVPPVGVLANVVVETKAPLQTTILDGTVTVEVGFTVIVYVLGVPGQLFTVGITVIVALIDEVPVLVALKPAMFPVPEAPKPIAVLLFAHV